MSKDLFLITCPTCQNDVEVSSSWAEANEKICYQNCNKAFNLEFQRVTPPFGEKLSPSPLFFDPNSDEDDSVPF